MNAEILIAGFPHVDFAPGDLLSEVSQNIRSIITTPKGSVPIFREFGLDENIVDMPVNSSLAKIRSEIILAVKKFEPRAKISRINFEHGNDGRLSVRINFTLQEASS